MIIDMARLGHSREAIAAATGRKYNHIRQVIFQAKRAGVLTVDASTTQAMAPAAQATFSFDFDQTRTSAQPQGARHG